MTDTNKTARAAAVAGRTTMTTRGVNRKLLARKAAAQVATGEEDAGDALEDVFPAPAADDQISDASDGVASADLGGPHEPAGSAGDGSGGDAGAPAPPPAIAEAASVNAPLEYIESPAADAQLAGAPSAIALSEPEGGSSSAALAAPAPAPASASAWSEADETALQTLLARRKAAGFQRRGRDVGGQLIRAGDVAPNPDTVVAVIVGLVAQAGGAVGRAELIALMASATFPHPRAQPADKGWCQGYVAGAVRNGFLAVGDAGEDRARPQSGNRDGADGGAAVAA